MTIARNPNEQLGANREVSENEWRGACRQWFGGLKKWKHYFKDPLNLLEMDADGAGYLITRSDFND